MADQPADLPFHSASASPEELAKAIWEAGKESIADKLGTFDNSLVLTNKVIKEGARGLEQSNDKFAPEAQVMHAATPQQLCAGGGASRPCTALLQSWAVSMQAMLAAGLQRYVLNVLAGRECSANPLEPVLYSGRLGTRYSIPTQ